MLVVPAPTGTIQTGLPLVRISITVVRYGTSTVLIKILLLLVFFYEGTVAYYQYTERCGTVLNFLFLVQ